MYEYLTMRYDYESDDLIEEDEPPVEAETLDEDLGSNEEEEEIRLDTIESDLSDEDDGTEE
jgi:hypothetical protein